MKRTRTVLTPELRKAKKAYWTHKYNAINRGLVMELSFEQWYDIWQQSGHWNDRGRGKGKYCMSRVNDHGNYSLGNVFIQLIEQNSIDGGGRPAIYAVAMTNAERQKRYRDKKRQNTTI